MFISSFVASGTPCSNTVTPAMSAQRSPKVVVGTVVRRHSEEVVAEMARIARYDKARMSAQAEEAAELAREEKARMTAQAPPTPLYPGRYRDGQRPRRLRQMINPAPAPRPDVVRVAAIKAAAEEEAHLIEATDRLVRRPRAPTPPRRSDDHFDLAKFSVQRWR